MKKEKKFEIIQKARENTELYFAFTKGKAEKVLDKFPKEEQQVLQEMITEDFFEEKTKQRAFKSKYSYVEYFNEGDFTEENLEKVLKNPRNYKYIPGELRKNPRILEIAPCLYEEFGEVSDNTLICVMYNEPNIFQYIPKDRMTKEILYKALEILVKTDWKPEMEGNFMNAPLFQFDNVPEELKDRVYHQARAMVDFSYLSHCPAEYKNATLIKYSVEHIFQKKHGYTYPLQILEKISKMDLEKTLKDWLVLECCKRHFSGVTHCPEEYKNDTFYNKLIDEGMYDFIQVVDLDTISEDTLLRAMKLLPDNRQFSFWNEKKMKGKWKEELAMEYARVSHLFYDHVPSKMITAQMAKINIKNHGTIAQAPEKFWDDEMAEIAMNKCYRKMDKIPKQYLTKERILRYVKKGKVDWKDLPEEYQTKEMIECYLSTEEGKSKLGFENIPQEMITKELIQGMINTHLSQHHQTEEISQMIYEVFKEELPVGEWKYKLYLLGKPTLSMVKDMENYLTDKEILNGLLKVNQEIMDYFFEKDEKNIIYFKEEFKDLYRPILEKERADKEKKTERIPEVIEEVVEKKVEKIAQKMLEEEPKEVKATYDDNLFQTFEQLSIFDFI